MSKLMKLRDGRKVTPDTYRVLWTRRNKYRYVDINRNPFTSMTGGKYFVKSFDSSETELEDGVSNKDLTPGEYNLTELFKEGAE